MQQPAAFFASAYDQLSVSERSFVDEYVDGVARHAAIKGISILAAFQRHIGDADVQASRGMLGRALVRAAVADRVKEIAEATELTPRRLVREVMAVGFSNMEDYLTFDEVTNMPKVNLHGCTRDQMAAISGLDIEMDPRNPTWVRSLKIRLHPKMDAIGKLSDYMAVMVRDNEYWKQERATVIEQARLPSHATEDEAANLYSQMINVER